MGTFFSLLFTGGLVCVSAAMYNLGHGELDYARNTAGMGIFLFILATMVLGLFNEFDESKKKTRVIR